MIVKLTLVVLASVLVVQQVEGLWPIPRKLQTGRVPLRLAPSFFIQVNVPNAPADILDAVTRTKAYLVEDKMQRLIVGRGVNDTQRISSAKALTRMSISIMGNRPVKSIANEAILDISHRSEGYTLTVPSDGSDAKLIAQSTLGLLRGWFCRAIHHYAFIKLKYSMLRFNDIWPALVSGSKRNLHRGGSNKYHRFPGISIQRFHA